MLNKLFDIDQPVTKVNTWASADTFLSYCSEFMPIHYYNYWVVYAQLQHQVRSR